MKRREFIKSTGLLFGGLTIAPRADSRPCPPQLTVDDGSSNPPRDCVQPPTEAPPWLGDLDINRWTPLPNANVFSDVYPPNIGQYGSTGPQSVFIAWCGAAYASQFGRSGSMIHWGGGHRDYYGNELYSFDLETLTWSRLSDPSPHATGAAAPDGIYPDQTPMVPHTWHYIGYRPDSNAFFTTLRELNNFGGYHAFKVSAFNLDGSAWFNSTAASGLSSVRPLDGCVYDSERDVIWLIKAETGLAWSRYSFATDSWQTFSAKTGAYNGRGYVYVSGKDCVLVFTPSSNKILGLDPGKPNSDRVELRTTDAAPFSIGEGDMYVWSENLQKVVAYPSRSNALYTLTPPDGDWRTDEWHWQTQLTTGSSGTHSGPNGTFGKFQLAEWGSSTACLLNADLNGPCYAVRLT